MNKDETYTLEMFIRVHGFGIAHADTFPATTRGSELFLIINTAISELRSHAASQSSKSRASREGTTLKGVALTALQDDLEAISRTARAIALTIPGFDDRFRLPRNISAQAWLAVARSVAQDAEPHKQEFIRRGLPADFLEDLNADIAQFELYIERKAQDSGEGVAATAAIDEAIERGMNAAREIDIIVRNTFRDDPATLAEWTSARHIERAPRHAKPQTTKNAQPAK